MGLRRDHNWNLTQEAFERLLARLAPDRDQAAGEYERIRKKLFNYFDWRGSPCPDARADETLDRVARRLDEGEQVEELGRYVYGVARRVLFEWRRRQAREEAASEEARSEDPAGELGAEEERRLACLERCLEELPAADRSLILDYHLLPEGSPLDARTLLARRLGIPYGTLKTRAHRARGRLEACLRDCLGARAEGTKPGPASHADGGTQASMGSDSETDQEMTGYLLGTLPEEAQAALEERYFTDEGFYEELLATADELIHAYLVGGLSPPDRARFESHFLSSPWRRQRLDFVRDMLAVARRASAGAAAARPVERGTRSARWSRWGIAATLLLAASALLAILMRSSQRDQRVSTSPTPPVVGPASPTSPSAPLAGPSPSPTQPGAVAHVKAVRVPRQSAGPVEIALAPPARSLRLEVEVEGGHLGYDAVMKRNGRTVWSAKELTRSHPEGTVLLDIPADRLAGGDYVLSIEGEASRSQAPAPPRVVTLRIVRPR